MDFLKPREKPVFEKLASTQLSENPQEWEAGVLNELYRIVPEAGSYTPKVTFFKSDEEQGYAMGAVVLYSRTQTAMTQVPSDPKKIKAVVIPVIIKQYLLLPLDVVITPSKRMVPLTPQRLREALFRPETFELLTRDWSDSSLYGMLHPPGRTANEFGSGSAMTQGGSDSTSYIYGPGMKFSMVAEIAPTLGRKEVQKLASALENDPSLMNALTTNPNLRSTFEKLAAAEDGAPDSIQVLESVIDRTPVHVAQFGYNGERYWCKRASRNFLVTGDVFLDRKEFLKIAGQDIANKVDREGTVTISEPVTDTKPLDASQDSWKVITTPGIYKVKTVGGKEIMGWVIPSLVAMDGTRMPMSVFSNGMGAMVQDQILGVPVATGVNLPDDPPSGIGVFYMGTPAGIQATVPMNVNHATEGSSYAATTLLGERVQVEMVPGLQHMVAAINGRVSMPASAKFMKLEDEALTPLVSEPGGQSKTAADSCQSQIQVLGGDNEIQLQFQGLPNLQRMMPKTANYDQAIFTLCVAGLSAADAHGVLHRAEFAPQTVKVAQDVRLLKDVLEQSKKVAEEHTKIAHELRRQLMKEAAVLPDIQTVDSVLSLGFINPENIRTFIQHLPYLELSLHKVCELLLASRVGLSQIPEAAASRAARGLDDVIQGLRGLMLRKDTEDQTELQQMV